MFELSRRGDDFLLMDFMFPSLTCIIDVGEQELHAIFQGVQSIFMFVESLGLSGHVASHGGFIADLAD